MNNLFSTGVADRARKEAAFIRPGESRTLAYGGTFLVAVFRLPARRKTNFHMLPLSLARNELLKSRGKPEGRRLRSVYCTFTALLRKSVDGVKEIEPS